MKFTYIHAIAPIVLLTSVTSAQDRQRDKTQDRTVASDHVAAAADDEVAIELLVEVIASTDDPVICGRLLKGMLAGLEGRRNLPTPKGWNQLSKELASSSDEDVRKYAMELSQIFGDSDAIEEALAIVQDTNAETGARRSMLRSLLNLQNKKASSLLESLLDEPELAMDAIRGYAIVENDSAPTILLQRFDDLSAVHQRAVVETLASRETYANELLQALVNEAISRDDIPAHVARSLHGLLGDRFTSVYGEVRSVGEDRQQLLAKYKEIATPEALSSADVSRGRAIFDKTCATCHKLYGEGGEVGPDLTGSNRANLDYILLNSVDPSYDVPDAYKTVMVTTLDGRAINGVLDEEDAVRIILRTAEEPRIVVAKEDIDERITSPKSMMPEGQLDELTKEEFLDLILYLRTTEQVELPK